MNGKWLSLAGTSAVLLQLAWPAFGQQDAVEPADAELAADVETAGADESRAVSFEVGAGLKHDSNVALLEIDTSTNAGDAITSLQFGLGYDRPSSGRFGLSAGYNFSESMHEDFDEFDLRLHRGSGTLSGDFGRTDLGAILQYAKAELDGTDFMTLAQISPYVSRLVGDKLFLRFAYTDSDKDFHGNPLRAARADSLASDVYVFLNGVTTYLLIGLRGDDEDAIDPQFDYRAERLRFQLSHRFALPTRNLTLKLGVRSETRDYSSITPSIGAIRRDERLQFEASAELPLGQRVVAMLGYQRADNESNLAAVDFGESVASLEFRASF
jgi:hypothetical protein